MEKMLKPYDREFMKMAMLKHEETFKQQVYELHRLYRVQKSLMRSIKHSRPSRNNQSERWDSYSTSEMIRLNQIDESTVEIEDESEIQLTLGPTSYYYHQRKKEQRSTPPTSDSGPSFSSSNSSSGTRSEELADHSRWGLTMVRPDSNPGLQMGLRKNNTFDQEEELSQDRRLKQQLAPWLFQPFGLNMT